MHDDHPAYHEHILGAADVCSNCMRTVRVERIDPTRNGLNTDYESYYARHERHTVIGYGPARSVTDQKGVFCSHCGTEHHDERLIDDIDIHDPAVTAVGYEWFKELAKNCMATLEAKGVGIDRHAFATTALARYDAGHGIDHCLGEATEHAIVSAAMASTNERDQRARAD